MVQKGPVQLSQAGAWKGEFTGNMQVLTMMEETEKKKYGKFLNFYREERPKSCQEETKFRNLQKPNEFMPC